MQQAGPAAMLTLMSSAGASATAEERTITDVRNVNIDFPSIAACIWRQMKRLTILILNNRKLHRHYLMVAFADGLDSER